MEDNKKSMADMAAKFADKEEDPAEDDDDSSSFEEVQKPVERPTAKAAPEPVAAPPVVSSQPTSAFTGESISDMPKATSIPASELEKEEPEQAPTRSASSAAGGLRDVLQEIRGLLQSQGKQIEQLTSEVAQLKAKVGE